ncbi:hypothetical protein [Streptomyces sp. NPDC059134]|uniref:hypothetical protein n=1 Tax=Streptomyces sp. NPDC059134 TaxID=3346738 RepID=UPI0036A24956
MDAERAERALDEIRRREGQTRAAHARFVWSPAGVAILAVALLVPFASYDLPDPWGGGLFVPWVVLMAGLLFVHRRRAPVRPMLTTRDAAWGAAGGVLLLGAFGAVSSAAAAAGISAPHALAAVVVTVCGVVVVGLIEKRSS